MARAIAALALFCGVMATASAVATAEPARDRVEKARAEVLGDEYQKDLPGTELDPNANIDLRMDGHGGSGGSLGSNGSADGAQRRHMGRRDGVRDEDDLRRRDTRTDDGSLDAGPLASLFKFLMWGVIIVGAALLIFWIATEVMRYGGDDVALAGSDDEAARSAVDLAVIQRPLGDAEELAARGEFTEAIHTLLLRTLQELVRSASVSVAPAMTSREILARVPLLADARDALAGLITAVEITHFGGDQATLDDYVRCRAQFQKFATAFRAGAMRPNGMQATGTSVA